MPKKNLPRVADVSVGDQPYSLLVRWERGGESLVNVSGLIETYRTYAPLRDSATLFRQVRVGEFGTDIVWNDELDMPADTLWRLAQEQSVWTRSRSPDTQQIACGAC